MHSRRTFLACGAAGSAAAAGLSGCLGLLGDESEEWLADLADPRPAVVPGFHVAYDVDVPAVLDALGNERPFHSPWIDDEGAALPMAGGWVADVVSEIDGVELGDFDRATGHHYREAGAAGVGVTVPDGEGVVVRGSWATDAFSDWLDTLGAAERLPGADEYARYGSAGGDLSQGFAAVDGEFVVGTRSHAGVDPSDLLDAELADGDGSWLDEASPGIPAVAGGLGGDDLAIATSFDLVAERPDTGEEAFDGVLAALQAAGIGVDVDGEEATIEYVLRYREGTAPDTDAVEAAVDRAAEGAGPFSLPGDGPTIDRADRSVTVTTTASIDAVREAPAAVRGLPFTGYGDLFLPVVPGDLGRDPPPRVRWTGEVRGDGRVAFEHAEGATVENVAIRYEHDGETRVEEWAGPVEEGDEFETAEPVDPGTDAHVVWRPDTPHETILATLPVAEA